MVLETFSITSPEEKLEKAIITVTETVIDDREEKYIDAKLKAISLENSFFKSKARLFKEAVISGN